MAKHPPFSKDNQPSPEAKSRGWDERAAKMKVRKILISECLKLLKADVVSEKLLDNIIKRFGIESNKITHGMAIMASVIVQAENGNIKALNALINQISCSHKEEKEDEDTNITIEHNVIK